MAVPCPTAVTTPPLVTVATAVLLLAQVPEVEGDKVVVAPIQMLFGPVILTVGFGLTVNCMVSAQLGVAYTNRYVPLAAFENVTVAFPEVNNTKVAPAGFPLCADQVPVVGCVPEIELVVPAHTV